MHTELYLNERRLVDLLADAVEIGKYLAKVEMGAEPQHINLRAAYNAYGRRNVDRWIREGLIKKHKDGTKNCKVRIDRVQLEIVSKASNRVSYFSQKVD